MLYVPIQSTHFRRVDQSDELVTGKARCPFRDRFQIHFAAQHTVFAQLRSVNLQYFLPTNFVRLVDLQLQLETARAMKGSINAI